VPIDIASLVAQYQQIKLHLEQQSAQFAAYCKPYNEQIEQIGTTIQAAMIEQGVKSVKTDTGTAYLSTIVTPKITDKEKFLDFVLADWDKYGAMLQIGAPQKAALQEYMDENDNRLPPHVDISSFTRINIRRA